MSMTKSELAEFLYIPEQYLFFNNGLWDVNCNIEIYYRHVKDGKIIVPFGHINGNFYCNRLNLSSLVGCPHTVNGFFNCSDNKLTSLKYCPEIVNGTFFCHSNELTSLKGCPQNNINGDFNCSNNKLTSLDYCPKVINGYLACYDNKISSIENIKASAYYLDYNNITYISDDIDLSDVSLYKNPYHYFKKYNYEYN